jgi:hypothetical protein
MIKINSYNLTPKTYFGIIIRRHLQKYWWLYLILFISSLYSLFSTDRSAFAVFIIIYGIIILPCVSAYYYFWATSSKNNSLFQHRQLTFENEKLSMTADGIYSELSYKHIQKIVETKDYLLLYISKAQFIYVPKTAFVDLTDLEGFKKLIKNAA